MINQNIEQFLFPFLTFPFLTYLDSDPGSLLTPISYPGLYPPGI